MINQLLHKEMKAQRHNYTSLAKETGLNPHTVKKALTGDAKISVYEVIAKALNKRIKYTIE